MNYALGYTFSAEELFENFKFKKLNFSSKFSDKFFKTRRKLMVVKVFVTFIKLVVADMIQNNITFVLPIIGKKACFHIKATEEEKFIAARQRGKWSDVDFLASNFKGYQMEYKYQTRGIEMTRLIYLDKEHKGKLTQKVNTGKQYC